MGINHGITMWCGVLLISVLQLNRDTKALRVIGGNSTLVQGGDAVLPCKLIETQESLSQISWQRTTREKPRNENFFTILPTTGPQFVNGEDKRFRFIGGFNDNNGTLLLSNVTLKDEGTYTCIFTLFPSGNHKTEIPLKVLVPPLTSLKFNTPTLGSDEVSFATCIAAGSKPPAEVKWLTGTLADKVHAATNSTEHANGTTTTFSSLVGAPTREINNHSVQCVITSAALSKEETLPFTIQVLFPPVEVNIVKTSPNAFECTAKANPPATFTWTRSGKALSESSVRVDGAKLHFLSSTSDLNGLYECKASNQYGSQDHKFYFEVVVLQGVAGWVLFGLLLSANVLGLILWHLQKSGHLKSIRDCMNGSQPVPGQDDDQVEQEQRLEQPQEQL